jgi:hypothetical protein
MSASSDVRNAASAIAAVLLFFRLYDLVMPLVIDYRFSRRGIDIVLFSSILVCQVNRASIKRLRTEGVPLTFFYIRVANRFRGQRLVVETTGRSVWLLTPKNARAAAAELGIPLK